MNEKTVLLINDGDTENTLVLDGHVIITSAPGYDIETNVSEVVDDNIVHTYNLYKKNYKTVTIVVTLKNTAISVTTYNIKNLNELKEILMENIENHIKIDLDKIQYDTFTNSPIKLDDIGRVNFSSVPFWVNYDTKDNYVELNIPKIYYSKCVDEFYSDLEDAIDTFIDMPVFGDIDLELAFFPNDKKYTIAKYCRNNMIIINADAAAEMNNADEFNVLTLKHLVENDDIDLNDLFNILSSEGLLDNIVDRRDTIIEWIIDNIRNNNNFSKILSMVESSDADFFTVDYTLGTCQTLRPIANKQELVEMIGYNNN